MHKISVHFILDFFRYKGGAMRIEKIVNSDKFYHSNTYLIEKDGDVLVIDPVDVDAILKVAKQMGEIKGVLVTHGHFDHCFGAKGMQEAGYKIYMSPLDENEGMYKLADEFYEGFPFFKLDVPVQEGNIQIGSFDIRVINTPGHSKGSVVYVIEGVAFTGDTLFNNDIGRYDLYGGSFSELRQSLRKLFDLEDMVIYPGHRETSTIATERARLIKR